MAHAIIDEEFRKLPAYKPGTDIDMWQQRRNKAVRRFAIAVRKRYSEGTLQRLLQSESAETRRAAILALGRLGTMNSNAAMARCLHDEDVSIAEEAAEAIWELWFRAGSERQNSELQSIIRLPEIQQAIPALDALIREAPEFAELFNQRAILHFQRGDFRRSLEDCRRASELNPFHFGALAGMGHCYLRLRMAKAAVHAYQLALKINPNLGDLAEVVRNLETALGAGEDAL